MFEVIPRVAPTGAVIEMFEVMGELEAMCGRLAARRITEIEQKQLAAAHKACKAAAESRNPDAYYYANEHFHFTIYAASHNGFLADQARRFAWLPPESMQRLSRAYGTRLEKILAGARSLADLGQHFGGDLYEREVEYLATQEWASSAQDVLWRRTKLGLHLPAEAERRLADWFAQRRPAQPVNLERAAR